MALLIGISEGLIRENSTGYELADKGKTFIESAMLDDENYLKEREFLSAVGKKISEKMVEETTKGWAHQAFLVIEIFMWPLLLEYMLQTSFGKQYK